MKRKVIQTQTHVITRWLSREITIDIPDDLAPENIDEGYLSFLIDKAGVEWEEDGEDDEYEAFDQEWEDASPTDEADVFYEPDDEEDGHQEEKQENNP